MKKILLALIISIVLSASFMKSMKREELPSDWPEIEDVQVPGPSWGPRRATDTPFGSVRDNLMRRIKGGVPPYTFAIFDKPQNGTLILQPNGDYHFNITGFPASFRYIVTDKNGKKSRPATFTIRTAGPRVDF